MKLIGFRKSKRKDKKYDAIIFENNKTRYVPFGALGYQQYKDKTGLGLYSHLDHNDKERRKRYRQRHKGSQLRIFSPAYFAWYYLW